MRCTYFLWLLVATVNLLLWTSCLGSSDKEYDYSPNAQIYAFLADLQGRYGRGTERTEFSIDQVGGRIFNKEPLPYLFHVDMRC